LTPSRSHRSRATAEVIGSFGDRSISCRAERHCDVGTTFKYGDLLQLDLERILERAVEDRFTVLLEKSASSSGSRGAVGAAPPRYHE